MVAYLNFAFDPATGAWVHGNSQNGGNAPVSQDSSSWITNIAYDYQQYSGGNSAPVVSREYTAAPSTASGGSSSFWNILNGISGAIDGVRAATNPGYNQPLNPNTPYYNQYGVPMNPGAPGTATGPGSGFMTQPVFAGLSGTHLGLIAAALVAGYLVLKK